MSSIFLSHSSVDKDFVRRLAGDLRENGFYVWVDEAEIKLGDSLIQKISEGIEKVEYVGAILSKNSIASEWVKHELDIAINQEISGKKVKVLPIMLERVEPPSFLKGKLYADFTSKRRYSKGLKLLIDRLSENPNAEMRDRFSKVDVDAYINIIKSLKEELTVNKNEKRLLIERLEKERSDISDNLKDAIDREESTFPEFADINKYYAFLCSGMSITAGYILHALRKEAIKGGPHQVAVWCKINDQEDELAILVEAILRRLHSLKK